MATTAAELNKLVDAAVSSAKAARADTTEQTRALEALRALSKLPVTTALLTETQAGKRLRPLSKHDSPSLSAAASTAIAAWKEVVKREAARNGKGPNADAEAGEVTASGKGRAREASKGGEVGGTAGAHEGGADDPKAPSPGASGAPPTPSLAPPADLRPRAVRKTGEVVRDRCREMLAGALRLAVPEHAEEEGRALAAGAPGIPAPTISPEEAAEGIESALHELLSAPSAPYKARFRTLHFNLKDPRNPDLRRRVLTGDLDPSTLPSLSAEDMASDRAREEIAKIREKKLFDASPSSAKQATTDQFQCGKCRQRKTTYYQMQTRSADEPMTTFVSCLNCNNRWKFC